MLVGLAVQNTEILRLFLGRVPVGERYNVSGVDFTTCPEFHVLVDFHQPLALCTLDAQQGEHGLVRLEVHFLAGSDPGAGLNPEHLEMCPIVPRLGEDRLAPQDQRRLDLVEFRDDNALEPIATNVPTMERTALVAFAAAALTAFLITFILPFL